MSDKVLDVIIIGAGPIGLTCGIAASKAKLDYLIIEKGVLVNSLYNFPANMTFFSTSLLLEIGEVPWNLKAKFYEAVESVESVDGIYRLKTNKQIYRTRSIIVSTGFYDIPRLMNIKGENLPKVKHYYTEPHPYIGQKVLVIGAANSACDAALELYYKGADVTMAVRKDGISSRVKYWIKPNIENRIKEGSIKAYFETTIAEITPNTVILNTPTGKVTLENDWVLAMTGYTPDFNFFRKIGIELAADGFLTPVHNKETLETNLPNVYIAGVINAGLQTSKLFIENTRQHATMIMSDLAKKVGAKVLV